MNLSSDISEKSIVTAVEKVEQIVLAEGNSQDISYFFFHKKRFIRMATTICRNYEPGQKILDIGSHYLHSSLVLIFLGYKVHSMDVAAFFEIELVRKRAAQFGITPIIENDFEKLSHFKIISDEYDIILFTEILEHITFNPISFWKHIERIIKNKGSIYISTPNSLTLYSILRSMRRMLTMRGIGIDVASIFNQVTYGHHWKEYSSSEIHSYFKTMSDGFTVTVSKYAYKPYPTITLKDKLRALFIKLNNSIPFFKGELEAIVVVNKPVTWKIHSPKH